MQKNGFYAAMKTDEGIRAVYIDEEVYRAQQAREDARQRKVQQKKAIAADDRKKRAAVRLIRQELKLVGMGAVLYWGYWLGLVAVEFLVPVLAGFQAVIAFRAGRWLGHQDAQEKRG